MPLSVVCILRGTKGINKSVLCVLPCCELPFNTFPRAALEMHYRGPEIEQNILNRPSAHVLFSAVREKQGETKTAMTFKIHRGQVLPPGLSSALQPQGNIMQFQCSLTVSREALSVSFLALLLMNLNKEVFSVTNSSSEHTFSLAMWLIILAEIELHL